MECLGNMKTVYPDENNVVLDSKSVERKPCIDRESKNFEITISLYRFHGINMKFLEVVTPMYIYQTKYLKVSSIWLVIYKEYA